MLTVYASLGARSYVLAMGSSALQVVGTCECLLGVVCIFVLWEGLSVHEL